MTVQQATQQLLFQLFHIYEEREARNIADLVMEKITEWKRIDRIVNKEVPLSRVQAELLSMFTTALLENRPVQYVLNEAWFFGMALYVDERVLIPRPETEELVGWIVREARQHSGVSSLQLAINSTQSSTGIQQAPESGISILDVGTGSGCIAIALKKNIPASKVYACDISEQALEVAKKNAADNEVEIEFIQCDFLDEEVRNLLPVTDLIVSNPPYILLTEKETMRANVLDYEPHIALFVEKDNPLLFYQAISSFAQTHLVRNGSLYVEIHEELGSRVHDLFQMKGFGEITLKQDLQEKDRMIKASASNT